LYFLADFQNTTKKFFFQSCFLVTKNSPSNCDTFHFISTYIPLRQNRRQRETNKGTKQFLAKKKHFFFFICSSEGKTRGIVFILTECGLQKQRTPDSLISSGGKDDVTRTYVIVTYLCSVLERGRLVSHQVMVWSFKETYFNFRRG
jgi:hypothetical protein